MSIGSAVRTDQLFPIGEVPPVGVVPKQMYAWTVRKERFGEPLQAFQVEIVDVPKPGRGEVIVCNYAAGINYNGVWAGLGQPKNVIADHGKWGDAPQPFHICGSESSGIVYAVGEGVDMVKVGDEVVVIGVQADYNCPVVKRGDCPVLSPTFRVWGYEANWGAFAQFSKVQQEQCVPKPTHYTWEEAAAFSATGATIMRMLTAYSEHHIQEGDVVLIWGGSGGLGTMAIQIVNYFGGIPIVVVSDRERAELCMSLGAKGWINRSEFKHFGPLEQGYKEPRQYKAWLREALKFRREIWNIVGERKNPRIVIEHPGENTLPTSMFVVENGGMVTICGGTSGYIGTVDLRYLWLGQKRLQGSHAGGRQDYFKTYDAINQSSIRPYLSKIIEWEDLAQCHQDIRDNQHPGGNMAVRIGLGAGK
ncbi:crotonyl-CoA carboxylase/reductase [Brevibacillus porteri]|uniref:Crotonyl-CoA carboxylase/reductase n=1 Tax=Brevibacillus porteri TaxID=2126350 RepID=A0ABX5FXA7_9BACL|nr:crotonyl-CoA carboxylase/reductase [Brevibacillus porteri]MED1798839.1 crotonyl-CoA carboxylase/reductase [Brevibacillus porteri]MED2131522.1 crotonyl-CoA carboxylase/reductase [Brevibacillus porteri]MED2744075.1 crotonyl-CoA carboxylase/reductase [Brevibacillus porteri]MED2813289.1 crotonyl-CoA carboxylase/reductase [Brevibacillus porteri]MED2896607.1 crotonyl-CoA carboxylase/reductase [Brevibacillus porteri]